VLLEPPAEYPDERKDEALQERFRRERVEAGGPVEVMLLAAESLDILKHTHKRYFFALDDIAST